LGLNTCPSVLGQVRLQDPRNLGLRSCHSQVTWIRRTFPAPRNLSLEGHVRPKLIIIIIIIDFALQIKSMFFYNNNFFFKFNNINEFNNIYDINYNKNNKIYNTNNNIFNIDNINYNKNKNIYNTNNNIKSCARAAMCWL
jgi:hypothetical protein